MYKSVVENLSKRKKTINTVLGVAVSKAVSLLSGIAAGLLLPKLLSVEGYGYYKTFALYSVYTAILHFGFIDGILLKFAGADYEDLDKKRFCTYSRFFIVFQLAIGTVLSLVGALISTEYGFIIFMLGINMIFINLTAYYQFISQATKRFAEYMNRNIISAVLQALLVVVFLVLKWKTGLCVSYKFYIIGLNAINGLMLLWYFVTYRGVTFGSGVHLRKLKADLADIFKQGIILTVAYQISHLIFALDRQFVSVLYDTTTFAVYSFAYSIINMISTLISSVSIVMFPILKRVEKSTLKKSYGALINGIAALVGGAVAVYFPLVSFIDWFLPEYGNSIKFLRIVFPALMFHCCIAVVMFTFSKISNGILAFFKNSLAVLTFGFLSNLLAYCIFKTPQAVSYASLVTMMFWFVIQGRCTGRSVGSGNAKVFLYLGLLSAGFLMLSICVRNIWLGMLFYLVLYGAITFVFHRCKLREAANLRKLCHKKP